MESPVSEEDTKMPSQALPDHVVRLTTASNPFEAHLLEQALKDEGVKSHVVGDYLDAGVGDVPGLYPEVWVHEDDLAQAQEILRRHQASRTQEAAEEPEA
jgi:hypothetical protein